VYRLGFLAKFSDLGDEAEEQQRERLGGKDATSILKYTKDTASSWIMRRSHTVLLCHLHTEPSSHARLSRWWNPQNSYVELSALLARGSGRRGWDGISSRARRSPVALECGKVNIRLSSCSSL